LQTSFFGSSDPLLNPAVISSALTAEWRRHVFAFGSLEIGTGLALFGARHLLVAKK
jgi:hypothetical protein